MLTLKNRLKLVLVRENDGKPIFTVAKSSRKPCEVLNLIVENFGSTSKNVATGVCCTVDSCTRYLLGRGFSGLGCSFTLQWRLRLEVAEIHVAVENVAVARPL